MRLRYGIPIHALAAAVVVCAVSIAIAQPASGTATAQRGSITGTIWRTDPRAGAFEILTGVGHSVRVRRIRFSADLKVMTRRSQVGISALAPGAVCSVECELAASVLTATGVEVLEPAPGRTP